MIKIPEFRKDSSLRISNLIYKLTNEYPFYLDLLISMR